MRSLLVLFLSLSFLVFFSACSQSDQASSPSSDEVVSPAAETESTTSPFLFNLDGRFEDWSGIEPLWNEGGAQGQGPIKSNVDIKDIFFKNDNQYIYVFMKISPSCNFANFVGRTLPFL